MISIHSEGTFGRLRYSLGGDRPSQTAHLTMSQTRIHGVRLESQQSKSGIPKLTPSTPKDRLLCLPPILCINCRDSISSYSKALRGLSVQSRVNTHLHVYYNFAGPPVASVSKSLRLSCGSELTRQGISLPLDRYSYGRRSPGLKFCASLAMTLPLNLPAPGRRQPLYVSFRFSRDLCFW